MTAAQAEWLAKGDADLGAASALMRRRIQQYPDQVCFLCQQSAEKCLKAFLVANQIAFPKTHNLLQLSDLCVTVDARFATLATGLAQIELYAVEIRYPGTQATVSDARQALGVARRVHRLVKQRLADMSQPKLL